MSRRVNWAEKDEARLVRSALDKTVQALQPLTPERRLLVWRAVAILLEIDVTEGSEPES